MEKDKLSSYQRLKLENSGLRDAIGILNSDIRVLIRDVDSVEYYRLVKCYGIVFDIEDSIMLGSSGNGGDGIVSSFSALGGEKNKGEVVS